MVKSSPSTLPLGERLRRFRILHRIKQQSVAADLDATQSLVSRWEAGIHEPSAKARQRIEALLHSVMHVGTDAPLRRLVESATCPMHLICDDTHELLAASSPREREWQARAASFLGSSLWRFATPQIVTSESKLNDLGWFDTSGQSRVLVDTEGNESRELRILPSTLMWEKVALDGGRVGRLVTTTAFR
jgi:transcriptional regulator with XRE-family HTH domain